MPRIGAFFLIAEVFRAEVQEFDDIFTGDGVIHDLPFPARSYHTERTEKGELVGDGALLLSEHQADVGDAHLGDEKGGKDLDAGGIRENGEEVRKVGDDLILREIIANDVLIMGREADGRIHNIILRSIYHHCQRRRPSKKRGGRRMMGQRGI